MDEIPEVFFPTKLDISSKFKIWLNALSLNNTNDDTVSLIRTALRFLKSQCLNIPKRTSAVYATYCAFYCHVTYSTYSKIKPGLLFSNFNVFVSLLASREYFILYNSMHHASRANKYTNFDSRLEN